MSDTPWGAMHETIVQHEQRIDSLKTENKKLRDRLTARTQEVERLRERVKELEEEMRDNPDI